jgi:membrane protein YqaA with SNARE-associated domain
MRNPINHKRNRHTYLNTARRHYEKHITIKEDAIYKPLLVTFLLMLFAMVIVFPNSIFDEKFAPFMSLMRTMASWTIFSAIATLFILPFSFLDAALIALFGNPSNTIFYILFAIIYAVGADTFFAHLGYKFSKRLSNIFARKSKKKDIEKSNQRLRKYGNIGMFFFSCTPLPFTLAIYTAGAIRLNKKGFLIAVSLGRLVKYSAFALFLRLLGINLVEDFSKIISLITGA